MKSENFVIIQGWMCNELELKGNDLLVFALIYGFSQDGESTFHGSRNYIANTFNISRPTVDKALQNLVDKQYIIKYETDDFNAPNTYAVNIQVVKKLYMGSKETLQGGSKETLLNNTSKQTTSKKEKVVSKDTTTEFEFGKQKPKKENLYTKCVTSIQTFTQDKNLRDELENFLQLRLQIAKDEGKSFYYGMWTHLLAELKQLAVKDGKLDVKLAWEIVNTSTIRCWKHFYELTDNGFVRNYSIKEKPWEKGVKSEGYTEEEKRQIEKEREEMEARGERVWY